MSQIKWIDGSIITAISTALNLFGGGVPTEDSGVIDNDSGLDTFADLELFINGFAGSVAQGTKVAEVYLVPTVDGTNFPDGADALVAPQGSLLVASFVKVTATGTGACRLAAFGIALPPRDYKLVIKTTAGQTWAASGNTLKIRPYKLQVV